MKVALFDFTLPEGRIATHPAEPRDSAKLLHVAESLNDRIVRELPQLLNPGDMLVFNNSRVIPARLFTRVGEKKIEVLLHRMQADGSLTAFARPAKKLKAGGFDTTVRKTGSGTMSRVLVGPRADRDAAVVLADKLKAAGFTGQVTKL